MSRIAYVNGDYVREEEAKISIFDRAFLFADAIYEVTAVLDGKLLDYESHLERLHRSLRELGMTQPLSDAELKEMQQQLIARNSLNEGSVYIQITRGVAARNFAYPENAGQTIVGFTLVEDFSDSPEAKKGIAIITIPDIRWQRRDIKTTGLLAQAMGKQAAAEAGAGDAWMVEQGYVTEGTASNAFIVLEGNRLVTRPLSNSILSGTTRRAILKLAESGEISIEQRRFTVDEAKSASEAFLTSATHIAIPVVEIDGVMIGGGQPGPVTRKLRDMYFAMARKG